MATGYTAQLMDIDFDLKKWLKENISRNFGLLLCLRDERNLSEEEILNELENEKSTYYEYAKINCLEKIKPFLEPDKKVLKEQFLLEQIESKQHREKILSKLKEEILKFTAAKKQLQDVYQNASGEVIPNILDFAIAQINLHLDNTNYSYYEKPHPIETMSFEEYQVLTRNLLEEDLARHNRRIKEEQTRNERNIKAYKELVKFVDDNIK